MSPGAAAADLGSSQWYSPEGNHELRVLGLTSTATVPGNMVKAFEEHIVVFEAIDRRDPDQAEQAARAHIRRIIESLRRLSEAQQS